MARKPTETAEDIPEDPPSAADRYRAPALDKGLDILEVLASQARGLTRAEIVKEMGLGPSQIYRMLERLVARGYVTRLEGGDRYALTMKLFLLGTGHPPLRRLIAQAQPMMDDFSRELRQSCHLVVPEHGCGIIIAQASPPAHWEFRARVGAQLDLFTTGSGMTLLAFQHPRQLAETLGRWGIADAASRLRHAEPELTEIRRQGFRLAPSAQAVGVTDLSVPVRGPAGDAMAVITCAYIEHPDDPRADMRSATLTSLIALAQSLSLDHDRPGTDLHPG
ncbi:IclR family transcriptional regulator [Paracoccus lutimaris]|uniref:IclR family transcriptional regulator n=1 Tax=Paracoccus lutimaris TaxID=1490030 RepID=A0A368Z903_9RHOB|nr:IclR family transcriptional regulator [Paracoccus lutimaris]RCW88932.1 IclR family transcriptional regulator [Paracoccus lutimaris]